jgi:hypothetical protein
MGDMCDSLTITVWVQCKIIALQKQAARAFRTSAISIKSFQERGQAAAKLNDDVKAIELRPFRYDARCKVRNCRARATTIARSIDGGGPTHHAI